ncbi:MAG TPA: ornithine cyclodeaminase family protein [Gemmatimonadaceae bacterium]
MTLILTRTDVHQLLDYETCIAALKEAFAAEVARTIPAAVLGTHVPGGGFHVKTAGLISGRPYYVAKINANFPDNPKLRGLPTIQGVICLYNAEDGRLLALLDSMEITAMRTAAASALAAKYLARPDSHTMTIIGAGNQGRQHLLAMSRILNINRAYVADGDHSKALSFPSTMRDQGDWDIVPVDGYREAVRMSDVVVTCTPSSRVLLDEVDVAPGTFIAAVGADSDTKREIGGRLMASSKVVADVLDQCAAIGDLHHAINEGVMSRDMVHAELADVVTGRKPGRTSDTEITLFDSTGTAIEDVAASSLVYERAIAAKAGFEADLGS